MRPKRNKFADFTDDFVTFFTKITVLLLLLTGLVLMASALFFIWWAPIMFFKGEITMGFYLLALLIVCPCIGIGVVTITSGYQEHQKSIE
ncbi:MAG: hypothetical protein ACJ76F_07980 [Bacteroidia bacterium]